jgi:hypothetical protein
VSSTFVLGITTQVALCANEGETLTP